MVKFAGLIVVCSLAIGCASTGENSASSSSLAGNPNSNVSEADKRVCKNESVVGSRLPVRTCLTQAQWDRRAEESRKMTEKMSRGGVHMNPDGG